MKSIRYAPGTYVVVQHDKDWSLWMESMNSLVGKVAIVQVRTPSSELLKNHPDAICVRCDSWDNGPYIYVRSSHVTLVEETTITF